MRQNSRGFNSYFIFIILLLMGVALLTSMNGSEEAYTKEQFIADMEADRVSEVVHIWQSAWDSTRETMP